MELGMWNTKQERTMSEIFFKNQNIKTTMNMHKGHTNGMSDNFHQFLFGTVLLCRPYLHIWISTQSTNAVNGLSRGSC